MNTPALFHPARLVAFCGALGFAFATPAAAQTVTTVPVGVMTYAIPAGTPAAPSLTAISFQLYDQTPPNQGIGNGAVGQITADSTTKTTLINVANGGWVAGALSSNLAPYLLRITSGAKEGKFYRITANTATTLTISGMNSFDLGTTFQIVSAETLENFFVGTNALLGGSSAAESDVVYLFQGGSWVGYYFNTTNSRWLKTSGRSLSTDNFGSMMLHPESGLMIQRKGAALSLVYAGTVPNNQFNASIPNSGGFVTNSGFPVDTTLGSLALDLKLSGWVKSAQPLSADRVSLFQGGSWVSYYNNGTTWRKVSGRAADESGVKIAAGTSIIITKIGAAANSSDLIIVKPF
jgi:hypothetical protein